MSEPISDAELVEWEGLERRATGGVWAPVLADDPRGQPASYYRGLVALVAEADPNGRTLAVVSDGRGVDVEQWEANTRFIAMARTALPRLIAEVRRLRGAR